MMAQILLAWLKLLAMDGDLAKAEPKTLRYKVLHAAARLVRGRRRRWKFQLPVPRLGVRTRQRGGPGGGWRSALPTRPRCPTGPPG
jgi:hypothetical protein